MIRAALLAVMLMTEIIRPHLAVAAGRDLSNERDVRYVVDAYAERVGRTFDRYHFDAESATQAVLFFPRYCRLTKGEWARRPFVLADWQAMDIIAPAFGWKCEDGTRRYRRGHIWVPRKNGKTELVGGIGLIHLLGDGEFGGEGYCVATKEDQAEIVFDVAKRMVLFNEELRRYIIPFASSLYCEKLFASLKVLGGKALGTHGKGMSFRLTDELHEFKDDRLIKFLDQGTGARQQPMSWDISTAGLQEGYGWKLWNVCRALSEGLIRDDRTLVVIYAADEDDDPYDETTWRKANPNFGVSLKREYMIDAASLAKRSASDENDFRRYHINQWIGQLKRWLKMDRWKACTSSTDPLAWKAKFDALRGRKCFGGADMASVTDLCAEVLVFPPDGAGTKWEVLVSVWMPRGDGDEFANRCRHERVPYDMWEAMGAIVVTPGNAADHDAIEAQIREDFQAYDMQMFGFDPWNAHGIMTSLTADLGERVVKVAQTMAGMSGPSKMLERLVLEQRMDHGNHPILNWMAANVATISDTNGNIKPAKDKSTQKIDGIVALIIALALTGGEEAASVPNIDAMVTL